MSGFALKEENKSLGLILPLSLFPAQNTLESAGFDTTPLVVSQRGEKYRENRVHYSWTAIEARSNKEWM